MEDPRGHFAVLAFLKMEQPGGGNSPGGGKKPVPVVETVALEVTLAESGDSAGE